MHCSHLAPSDWALVVYAPPTTHAPHVNYFEEEVKTARERFEHSNGSWCNFTQVCARWSSTKLNLKLQPLQLNGNIITLANETSYLPLHK